MFNYIPLILLGVFLNAFAQFFLKKGMISIGHFDFTLANAIPIGIKAAMNWAIVAGLTCYVVSVVVWMLVLSRVDVSYAYPFLSIGYILTTVLGYMFFNEVITAERIGGIVLICLGVVLVARS
ncbi:MAG: 4-amino-4-deoxy-L-arabinose transferase [Oleiphilus sp.]|nr:MAG: 4-amino-4-deoxy-L-arabinose transferase [Oleiphilus sp.]